MAGKNTTFLSGAHFDDPNSPRKFEHDVHAARNARPDLKVNPRVGGQHKIGQGTPPTHQGMTHMSQGALHVGGGDIKSALQSGSIGSLGAQLPKAPKIFPDTKPVVGQRSRTANHEVGPSSNHLGGHGLDHELGRQILDQAVHSGSTRLKP